MTDPEEYVCEKCFNDPKLIQWIREEGAVSNCGWCGATGIEHQTAPIEPEEDLYEESPYDHLLNPHAEKTI